MSSTPMIVVGIVSLPLIVVGMAWAFHRFRVGIRYRRRDETIRLRRVHPTAIAALAAMAGPTLTLPPSRCYAGN